MHIDVPGACLYDIDHVVLDYNGTLAQDGELLEGVKERMLILSKVLHVVLATADTFGNAEQTGEALGVETIILKPGGQAEQKRSIVRGLGAERTIAIGNGRNDVLMLQESALSICVVGPEGAASAAMAAATLVANDVRQALDLLLHPLRLVATLRN